MAMLLKLHHVRFLLVFMISAVAQVTSLEQEIQESEKKINELSLTESQSGLPSSSSLTSTSDLVSQWEPLETSAESGDIKLEKLDAVEDETLITKRNSITENFLQEEGGTSNIPQAAALQTNSQRLPLGGLSSRNIGGLVYQGGFHAPQLQDLSCGMCSRERNLCQIISGIFTRSPLPYGYSLVTPIPAAVCNITIVELKKSKNFFALRRKDRIYALNGDWDIQAAGTYRIAGTDFTYSPSDGTRGEKLEAPGPLLEPLDLMLIYQTKNHGIKYEYRVPLPDLVGQPPPARILPVSNIGSVPTTFSIDGTHQNQNSYHNIFSEVRRSSNIPTGIQPLGIQPHLSPRSPFAEESSTSHQGFSPIRHSTPIESSGSLSGISNWNNQFLPRISSSHNSPGRTVIGMTPGTGPMPKHSSRMSNQNFSPGMDPTYSRIIPSSGSKTYVNSLSAGNSDRFAGILNTDPRTVPNRLAPNDSKFPGSSASSSEVILGSSSTPSKTYNQRYDSLNKNTVSTSMMEDSMSSSVHRTRHKHGSRILQPGPAVGGNSVSHIFHENSPSRSSETVIEIPNQKTLERKRKNHGDKQRKRKKGKRRNGKKRKTGVQWVSKGLTDCSRPCGGGNQTSIFSCERRRKGKVVADRLCEDLPKPENQIISCNLKPCPAKWMIGDWELCSVTCGRGIQTRTLQCKQEVSPTLTMMVPEGACVEPKAEITKECVMEDCPSTQPFWKVGEWSECSSHCGNGRKRRTVTCSLNGSSTNDSFCSAVGMKPASEESCDMGSCVSKSTWMFSSWSKMCTETCESGVQTRRVVCLDSENGVESSCPVSTRPATTRTCSDISHCTAQWFAGPWSTCSVTCGSGLETRVIKCLKLGKREWYIVPESHCIAEQKPHDVRECFLDSCLPQWYTSEWGECSSTCGTGIQAREVKCLDKLQRPSADCIISTRPSTVQNCKELAHCPSDKTTVTFRELQTGKPATFPEISKEGQWIELDKGNLMESEEYESPIDGPWEKLPAEGPAHTENKNTDSEYSIKTVEEYDVTDSEFQETDNANNGDNFDSNNFYDNNEQTNELEVERETGSALNVIPDKDAQGDESSSVDEVITESATYDISEKKGDSVATFQTKLEEKTSDDTNYESKSEQIAAENETSSTDDPISGTWLETNHTSQSIVDKDETKFTKQDQYDEISDYEATDEDKQDDNKKRRKKKKRTQKEREKQVIVPGPPLSKASKHTCIDRIKNCHLVFRARLCRLKYYNMLCCITCTS